MDMTKVAIFIFILLLTSEISTAYQADVEYLPTSRYSEVTLQQISQAQDSVFVVMYYMAIYPNQPKSSSHQLVDALIEAKNRGVDVEVILDQNYDFKNKAFVGRGHNRNWRAYEYMTANGIKVYWDSPSIYTHNKVIVIDDEVVIMGSTNITKTSMTRNNESNVIIRSRALAKEVLEDLRNIEKADAAFENVKEIAIPADFLNNKDLLGTMVTSQDARSFQIYLYLIKEFDGNENGVVIVNHDKLAKSLGIEDAGWEGYRRQIRKVLRKLQGEYKLIELESVYGGEDKVYLKDLKDSRQAYSYPSNRFVLLPISYWDYGWNTRLSFRASVMYLLSRHYAGLSGDWPNWSIAQEILADKHHISKWFIGEGFQELREWELVDVNYREQVSDEGMRTTWALYTHKPLYDFKKFKERVKELASQYGNERVVQAQKYAAVGYAKHDLSAIKTVLQLEDRYGQAVIQEASTIVESKAPNNPKRNIGYLIGTIKSMVKENE